MQYFLLLKLKFMSWTHPIFQLYYAILIRGSQVALVVKSPLAKAGDIRDVGLIPGWGRSPGGGHDNPVQYSCLENPWAKEPDGLQSMGPQSVRHN